MESVVLKNMKTVPNYTPYCGNMIPRDAKGGCDNPMVIFDAEIGQFVCPHCFWVSSHDTEIIEEYKKFNNIK